MRTSSLCLIFLAVCRLSYGLVIVNETNLCDECQCKSREVECHFISGKSRKVSFFGVENQKNLVLNGLSNSEISLTDVQCQNLSISGFGTVIFKSALKFSNVTRVWDVENVDFNSKSSSGSIKIQNVRKISISERSFYNLKEFIVENVTDTLLMEDEALKSRGSSFSPPESKILFHKIHKIPKIPHNAFSLCHSVVISHSNVTHIEEFAFGGISIQNVTFVDSKIRRLERHAFPDMTLIRHLHFLRCDLTSLSQESITSAISSLTIESCNITSIAKNAFKVLAAAQVKFINNYFPLNSQSLVFKTWSLMEFSRNDFEFLENEAFFGISDPVADNSKFIFRKNRIRYANRGALKLMDFDNNTDVLVMENIFDKICECFYTNWLLNVVGEDELSQIFMNSSYCKLSERDISCRSFSSPSPKVYIYLKEVCASISEEEDPCNNPWVLIREKFRPDRDQGILLILLVSVFFLTLIVSIFTFFRWIAFLISEKKHSSNEEEWNFTHIEPLKPPETPSSGVNHYDAPREPLFGSNNDKDDDVKSSHRKSIVAGPTLTFYDEMIGFIKEKLDDPENYATVSDNACGDEYSDPFQEKNN
nr:uncharacterized protein LOC121119915 [Lepeophtheirus salmonis]